MTYGECHLLFDGLTLADGVYLYRLKTEREIFNERFIIAR